MPQFDFTQDQWTQGQVADSSPHAIDSYVNELLAQITTVTYAGDSGAGGAGEHTITAVGPDGESVTSTYDAADADTSADIATGHKAVIDADDDWANVATVVDDGSGELTFTFIHEGREYDVTATTQAGTVTVADTQDAGGTDIGLGLAVQDGSSDGLCAVLDGSTTDDDLVGITVRGVDGLVNDLDKSSNAFGPGKTVSVLRQGVASVMVEDAVTKRGDVFVRIANGTTTNPLGGLRSDADGGDAIQMTGAKFGSSTSGRGMATVRVNRP